MTYFASSDPEHLARCLVYGAAHELYLTPKPGLVDLIDSGSHHDLSVPKMERSIFIIEDYLAELCISIRNGEGLGAQKEIGRKAEGRMYRELGCNTHRGYIFLSGLLLLGWVKSPCAESSLREAIALLAEEFFGGSDGGCSNGRSVRETYRVGGIVAEARAGFPSLFRHGVPAWRETFRRSGNAVLAAFASLAALMQVVEDSTALHRCGPQGLARLRSDGLRLEKMIRDQEAFLPFLSRMNSDYVTMNLTMGGVADMLALTLGYVAATGDVDADFPGRQARQAVPAVVAGAAAT